jgi:phenylpyruvate tautomerase PptA (4-oxalocrotonate tautomerase family)
MAQIKIYGLKNSIEQHRAALSQAIHQAVVEALDYPLDKKFQRFISLDEENFMFPSDRSKSYTVIEISMFEGRSIEAKKKLISLLFSRIEEHCAIRPHDVEITIFETPKCNWGIRGKPGDELVLDYKVNV